jgi:hypothetical protein
MFRSWQRCCVFSTLVALFILSLAAGVRMVSTPLVSVSQETCDRIVPGMTIAEAQAIIGGPPRWYDGIHSFGHGVRRKNPNESDYRPRWVSSSGEIVIDVDDQNKVLTATFAPITVCSHAWPDLLWQRLTRGQDHVGEAMIFVLVCVLLVLAVMLLRRTGLLVFRMISVNINGKVRRGVCLQVCKWGFVFGVADSSLQRAS